VSRLKGEGASLEFMPVQIKSVMVPHGKKKINWFEFSNEAIGRTGKFSCTFIESNKIINK
jgi:hypothetical protein